MQKLKTKFYNFLHWSEKYTKTDMVYFASGNFWLLGGRFIAIGTGILLTIAFANLIPKETFGTYKYVISLGGILSAFALTGMGTSVTKSVAQGYDSIIKKSFWTSFRWSLAGTSFLSLIGSIYYFLNGNNILAISLIFIALSYPVLSGSGLATSFLHGKKDFKRLTLLGIPRNILSILIMLVTLLISKNILVIVGVYFISNTIISLAFYLYTTKIYKANDNKINIEAEKENERYAKHLSVMGFFTQTVSELDKLLLWHYAGATQLAIYAFAIAPIKEIRNLTENIFPLAMPKFANKSFAEVKKHLPFKIFQMTLIILPIVIIYILFAPILFKFLFPQYINSVIYTQLFALSLLMQPSGFIATALTAHAKIKQKYIVTVVSSIFRILLFVVLIPLYGILGIIYSVLISELLTYIVLFYILKKS